MGWRKHISREVSSSLPAVGLRLETKTTSKLKISNISELPAREFPDATELTAVGRTIQATSSLVTQFAAVPRLMSHAAMITFVGAVVLAGSTGHSTRLNPQANIAGFGSVMDQAAALDTAAKVATESNLLVTPEVNDTAKTLNAQTTLPTSDEGTLANSQVVDTVGNATRGLITRKVESGDTLASLATEYNVTTDTIRWANGLGNSDNLTPGKNLTILPISGVLVKVNAGDTAASLAAKYQSNAEQITAFNNAELKGLQAGQTVVIPDGVMPTAPAKTATSTASSSRGVAGPLKYGPGSRANGYSYGYCTWYVASRRAVPGTWGNANAWYYNAQISGYSVGSAPRVGAIAWTGAGYYGHVAYVEAVNGDGSVTVSEMNYAGWNRVSSRTVPASSFRYIY